MSLTYRISADGRAITCFVCGRTSFGQGDIKNLYCGHCHQFHELMASVPPDRVAAVRELLQRPT